MSAIQKLFDSIIAANSDTNINFDDLRRLLIRFGFDERTRGSHHMFTKPGIADLINMQRDGANAKDYQVRQIRSIINKNNLKVD